MEDEKRYRARWQTPGGSFTAWQEFTARSAWELRDRIKESDLCDPKATVEIQGLEPGEKA